MRKRKTAVDAAADTPASEFLRRLQEAEMDDNVVHFATNLFGKPSQPQTVLVRECYKKLYKDIVEFVDEEKEKNGRPIVQVWGTPGTGKTVCGLYMMLRLLKERGETVVYLDGYDFTSEQGCAYLLGPKNSEIVSLARNRKHVIEEGDSEYWWGKILVPKKRGKYLLDFLLNQPNLWCVLDPFKDRITFEDSASCVTIVFSSPHHGSTYDLGRELDDPVGLALLMPLWEMEELNSANRQLDHPINVSDLEERFALFGGVARRVLAEDYAAQKRYFYKKLGGLTLRTAERVMDPFSSYASSLFVHIVPAKNFKHYNTRVATDVVARRIGLRFALLWNWELSSWFIVARDYGLGTGAGSLFEYVWHNAMALGRRIRCKLRNLDSKETTIVQTPRLPHLQVKMFDNNDMTDLENLKEGQYCVPFGSNFETADSWLVMRKPFVDKGNENLCLVQFQVTTAAQRDLPQAGEMCVIQKAEGLFGVNCWEGRNIYIVFVVLQDNFAWFGKQKWTNAKGEEIKQPQDNRLNHIRQFTLAIPKELEPHTR